MPNWTAPTNMDVPFLIPPLNDPQCEFIKSFEDQVAIYTVPDVL